MTNISRVGEELVLDWPIGGQYRCRCRPIGAQSLYRFNISTLLSFSFSRSFRIFLHFVSNHFSIERAPFSLDFYFTFVPCFIFFLYNLLCVPLFILLCSIIYSCVFHACFVSVPCFILNLLFHDLLLFSMLISFLFHALFFFVPCFILICSILYSYLFHALFFFVPCLFSFLFHEYYSFLVSYFIFFILYSFLFQAFYISVPWISFFCSHALLF